MVARLHPSELAGWFGGRPWWLRAILPLFLGAIVALGHEAWRPAILAVAVGLILSFLMVPKTRRAAAWFGWLLGLGYFGVTLRWLVDPFLVDPVRHGWMAPFAILFMAGGLALFWALAFWGARWIARGSPVVMLWLPLTLAAAELARGHVFSGFPWGLLSYTLIGSVADVWFAWVGPYGLTVLLVGVLGVTAYCLHSGWTLIWPALVGVLFATLGLQAITPTAPTPSTASTVRLIQPNAPQHLKWDREWAGVFFQRALEQTGAGDPPDVVIWPETSVPTLLDFAGPFLEDMSLAARGAPVVAGIQRRDGDGNYFNAAIVLEGPTTVTAIADKSHLVPFGEYIPAAHLLRPLGLGTLVDQVAGFRAGTGDGLVEVAGLGLARVLICYEGIFPEEIQRGEARPDVIMILTNDAWFGAGAGPRQHLVQARARAIEQGLPVVRSANTGISAVIDARGAVLASLPLNEAGYLDAQVPGVLPPTLYVRIGDWPLLVLLVLCIAGGVASRLRNKIDVASPRG